MFAVEARDLPAVAIIKLLATMLFGAMAAYIPIHEWRSLTQARLTHVTYRSKRYVIFSPLVTLAVGAAMLALLACLKWT